MRRGRARLPVALLNVSRSTSVRGVRRVFAITLMAMLAGCGTAGVRRGSPQAPHAAARPASTTSRGAGAAPTTPPAPHTFLNIDQQGRIQLSGWAKPMMPAASQAVGRTTIAAAAVQLEAGPPGMASVHLETATALDQSALYAPKQADEPNEMFDAHHVDVTFDHGDAWAHAAVALWQQCAGHGAPVLPPAQLAKVTRAVGNGSDVRTFVVRDTAAALAVLDWAHRHHLEIETGRPTRLQASSSRLQLRVTDARPRGVLLQCARRYAPAPAVPAGPTAPTSG